jgi:hypothetical protein
MKREHCVIVGKLANLSEMGVTAGKLTNLSEMGVTTENWPICRKRV